MISPQNGKKGTEINGKPKCQKKEALKQQKKI
jgi:hypothetical protein